MKDRDSGGGPGPDPDPDPDPDGRVPHRLADRIVRRSFWGLSPPGPSSVPCGEKPSRRFSGKGSEVGSLVRLLATDPGFDPAGTLTLLIALDPGRYPDSVAVHDFVSRARERLDDLPDVEAVGTSEALPLATGTNQTGVSFPGAPAPGNTGEADADNELADVLEVSPGFFRAAGMRLLEGRGFSEADAADRRPVAVIDDVPTRRFFPDTSSPRDP